MTIPPPIIERAFQLARSGSCASIVDLRRTLRQEGYEGVHVQIAGRSLVTQLTKIMKDVGET